MSFLNSESGFMQGLGRLYDYLVLGLLWAAVSLPVVTFGAASVAALYTAESSIEKHGGQIAATFFRRFRAEFRQATLVWLLAVVLIGALLFDVYLFRSGEMAPGIRFLSYAIIFVMFCWVHLWFGYLYKFTEKTGKLMYNAFCMVFQNFFLSILSGGITLLAVAFFYVFLVRMPPLLLIVPGAYLMAQSFVLRKILSKYIPEIKND